MKTKLYIQKYAFVLGAEGVDKRMAEKEEKDLGFNFHLDLDCGQGCPCPTQFQL